ncbi:MAG: NTP transferase domain-containing protein [Allomuricauda sp.]
MEKNSPKLYGLVLAGGKSTRMGSDKGLLTYHDVPQQEHLYFLLEQICDAVFLSVRKEQRQSIPERFNLIVDKDEYRGPFNGMLSAHAEHTEVAWLVLACDLPLMDREALEKLVEQRDATKSATSFATKKTGLPEPLITIWEPKGLKKAMEYLKTSESSCPRKFLINSEIRLVFPEQDEVLYNANSVSDYEFIKSKIH